ncbi:MAG: ATP-binding protein [Verrucomicrobiota bacterium]
MFDLSASSNPMPDCDNRWLQTLFDSMTEGVLLLDGGGRVRLLNTALAGLLGVTDNPCCRTVSEAFHWEQLDLLVQQVLAGRSISGAELKSVSKPDRILQVNASPFGGTPGQPEGVLLVFHDVSRMKQLENTRQEFVANVSHELRTPLSLIKGFVETLLDGAVNDPQLARRFLHTIDKHADRLTFLIEDLLTISRLESGQIALNLQAVDLRLVATRVVDDLDARSREKQTVITNRIPELLAAMADADRLQQVLFNLVENAIKYGRSGGSVVVGARLCNGSRVEIWVQDDGPGIPPEAKARVFERFYRVDRARSRDAGGTGLGLAIVKHIVQAHGGEVWLESELGKGAVFHFTLPKAS